MASISASESLTPGISRLVISSQTPVSCLRYRQGLQHRVQGGKAHPGGEVAGESLQVHVRRVDVSEELRPRLRAHVPGRHRHRLDARLPACIGHVDRVLQEDHRVVVGERDAAAPPAGPRPGRWSAASPGRRACRSRVIWRCPSSGRTGSPGCTRPCRRTAPRSPAGNGSAASSRPVHTVAAGAAVGREHDRVLLAHPHEAEPPLPLVQTAGPRAHIALDPPVTGAMPVPRRYRRTVHGRLASTLPPGRR